MDVLRKNGPSDSQAKTLKSVDEIMGVTELVVKDDCDTEGEAEMIGEISSPRSSLRMLQHDSLMGESFFD